MKNILKSPCIYCDYKGKNYWKSGTHMKDCPFHRVDGKKNRKAALPYIIRKWAAVCYAYRHIGDKRDASDRV